MKVWINTDVASGEHYVYDVKLHHSSYGPIEISNELYERFREAEREFAALQDILDSLVYDWKYPDDDEEMDCE